MSDPDPPQGVQVTWPTAAGRAPVPLEVTYAGVDDEGDHVWEAVLTPELVRELTSGWADITVDVLPARTTLRAPLR